MEHHRYRSVGQRGDVPLVGVVGDCRRPGPWDVELGGRLMLMTRDQLMVPMWSPFAEGGFDGVDAAVRGDCRLSSTTWNRSGRARHLDAEENHPPQRRINPNRLGPPHRSGRSRRRVSSALRRACAHLRPAREAVAISDRPPGLGAASRRGQPSATRLHLVSRER